MGAAKNTDQAVKASPSMPKPIDLSSDTEGEWYAIRVGTGGDLKVDYRDGEDSDRIGVVLNNAADGSYEPGIFTKIYSTANGTTASNLVAFIK